MKYRFLFFLRISALLTSSLFFVSSVHAEPLQDGFRYGTYGLVAGALLGGASMAFSEDPGSHLTPVAKGASLGLYVGLAVTLFKNLNDTTPEPKYELFPIGIKSLESPRVSSVGLGFHTTF